MKDIIDLADQLSAAAIAFDAEIRKYPPSLAAVNQAAAEFGGALAAYEKARGREWKPPKDGWAMG
jgi:hypothetical protein